MVHAANCSARRSKIVYRQICSAPPGCSVPEGLRVLEEMLMSPLPLSGIKILDLTRVLAGPCRPDARRPRREVIKIERRGAATTPGLRPALSGRPQAGEQQQLVLLCANRTRSRFTVNIATAKARRSSRTPKVLRRDDGEYKVGDLKRYKLDYEAMKRSIPASSTAR